MTKKLSEAELGKTLKSIIAAYEKALVRAKENMTKELAKTTVQAFTMANLIDHQENAAPWLMLKRAIEDHPSVTEALKYVRTHAVATVLNWSIGHNTQGVHQALDNARFTGWQNFILGTKGLI